MRHAVVLIHRYLGLTMALFLIVAGLTGSLRAFENEIDAWLNPQLFSTETRGKGSLGTSKLRPTPSGIGPSGGSISSAIATPMVVRRRG